MTGPYARPLAIAAVALVAAPSAAAGAQLQMVLPLARTSYQTNERIDLSVVRSDIRALAAGSLLLTIAGSDGSKMTFAFAVGPSAVDGPSARTTENFIVDGRLLRPGAYTVTAACDGTTATTAFALYDAVRRSTYRTVHWGGPGGVAMLGEGDSGLGFNLVMSTDILHQEPSIAAGVDVMGNCLMGGGHQHDLRPTNDWSDPNVFVGAIQRGLDRAFSFRTLPNAIGAHLHDEPGLTSLKNAHTGAIDDQDIAPQRAAYERAFGREALWSDRVHVQNDAEYAQWTQQNDFKLGFMDAFWKASEEAVARLKPGFLAVTQSQYGWNALFEGYYFNVVRSLPVVSGHGGYDDFGLRNMNPSFFLEMAMARELDKPNWYMPEWFGDISADEFRLEHNLSFITGIQGMSTPPGVSATSPSAPAVIECNRLYQRLGTIFTTPEHTAQDLTILYSKSNQYYSKKVGQPGLGAVYLATKLLQYPVQAVVEEDVLDGSLAANHKAVILTGITHLDPPVAAGLEAFVRDGGTVLETLDCTVAIRGASKVQIEPDGRPRSDREAQARMGDVTRKKAESLRISSFHYVLENAKHVAAALGPALLAAGLKPAFVSDVPTIAAGKQVRGEIEYDFAVNFTVAPNGVSASGGLGVPVAATAKIVFPNDGRPIYDAGVGRPLPVADGTASIAFGPGQMLAVARSTRAIGGVQVGAPIVTRDYTGRADPIRVNVTATLVDTQQKLIAGAAPMDIRVIDPSGSTRYALFRSAEEGILRIGLPLAANDLAGTWTVTVTELLSGRRGDATFLYRPASQCGAVAGRIARAVVFPDDVTNIYKFFRDHRSVTVVPGSASFDDAAAQRMVESLKPYDVRATIERLADAERPLPLTDDQAATWCGNEAAGSLDAAARAQPSVVGYNLTGPTVLIGSPADHPLIAFLEKQNVLPYKITADFPGRGHGVVAWNLMSLGHDIESLVVIGNDAAGIAEAVGTALQIGIGVEPLTPYVLPQWNVLTARAPWTPIVGRASP